MLIFLILLIIYLLIGEKYDLLLRCPFRLITGLYCPGCGITRMLISILKLDFYQAFRYNPLVFIMLPFMIIFFINYIYAQYFNKKAIINNIPNIVWYIVIFILIVYGILRNIFPILAPSIV